MLKGFDSWWLGIHNCWKVLIAVERYFVGSLVESVDGVEWLDGPDCGTGLFVFLVIIVLFKSFFRGFEYGTDTAQPSLS